MQAVLSALVDRPRVPHAQLGIVVLLSPGSATLRASQGHTVPRAWRAVRLARQGMPVQRRLKISSTLAQPASMHLLAPSSVCLVLQASSAQTQRLQTPSRAKRGRTLKVGKLCALCVQLVLLVHT